MDGIIVLAILVGMAIWKWRFVPRLKIREAKSDAKAMKIREDAESKVAVRRAQTEIKVIGIYRKAGMDFDKIREDETEA